MARGPEGEPWGDLVVSPKKAGVVVHLLPVVAGVEIQRVQPKAGLVEACGTREGLRRAGEEARTAALAPGSRGRQEIPGARVVAVPRAADVLVVVSVHHRTRQAAP